MLIILAALVAIDGVWDTLYNCRSNGPMPPVTVAVKLAGCPAVTFASLGTRVTVGAVYNSSPIWLEFTW